MDEHKPKISLSALHSGRSLWPKSTTSDGMFSSLEPDDFYCSNCGHLSFKSTSVKQPNGKNFCSYCNRLQKNAEEIDRIARRLDSPVLRDFREAVAYEQKLFRERRLA